VSNCEAQLPEDTDRLIEELQQGIKARDQLLATVAHELRNPMTPILVQVQSLLMSARRDDERSRETMVPRLERLQFAVDHYVKRATMLLDLSRTNAGSRRLECTEVDFSALLREIVGEQEVMAAHAGSPIASDIQDAVVGTWDRLALEQVAENLISNAVKYGAGRPIAIALTADGGVARLVVRDQGIGIAVEDQVRIFGRFERAVTRRAHGGFGVGLWLVNQLVSAMGGEIAIASRKGKGSTFSVAVPLQPAPDQEPT
jgi:two-component system, OmpR family, sensor kinase